MGRSGYYGLKDYDGAFCCFLYFQPSWVVPAYGASGSWKYGHFAGAFSCNLGSLPLWSFSHYGAYLAVSGHIGGVFFY